MEVVEELYEKLFQNKSNTKIEDKDKFSYYSKLLMKQQKSVVRLEVKNFI